MRDKWRDGPRIKDDLPERTAETASQQISADATVAVSGFGSVGYPKAIPLALAESGRALNLTLITGGSVGEEIDPTLVEADAISRWFPYQSTLTSRQRVNDGKIAYHDRHLGGVSDEVAFGGLPSPDVAVVEAVSVGADWLVPSASIGSTPAFVEEADSLIVEVNRSQPRDLGSFHDVYRPDPPPDRDPIPLVAPGERIGSPIVSFEPDALSCVVETDRRDSPYEFREPTAADRGIGENFRSFLHEELRVNPVFQESLRIQFGVGSLGNALMGALGEVDVGDRSVAYFGEVIQDGLLDLLADGTLDTASATSLALSSEGQDRLFANIETLAEGVWLRPADVTNAAELISRLGVLGVNSALEVDLYGHVNSTHVDGSTAFTGIGGSNDFNRNAVVSVVALPSTTSDGDTSRVVPMVPHVDHTEHDIDVVITEQGIADLRGLSPRERALALLDRCAHPDFRPELRSYLDRARNGDGHVPHDLDTCFSWTASGGEPP